MSEEFDPLRAIRRSWWVVVVATFFGAAALGAVNATTPKTYTSNADILYQPRDPLSLSGGALGADDRALKTQSSVLTSDVVLAPVAKDAHVTARELRKDVTVDVTPNSNVITLHVTGTPADGTQRLAVAIVERMVSHSRESGVASLSAQSTALGQQISLLSRRLDADTAAKLETTALSSQLSTMRAQQATLDAAAATYPGDLSVISNPDLPLAPSTPSAKTGAAEGGALGSVLGILVAFARGRGRIYRRPRRHEAQDLRTS